MFSINRIHSIACIICIICYTAKGYEFKIVNGTAVRDKEFPFMVSLRYSTTGLHICGATLLNRLWLLTAAHCVLNSEPHQLNVQYGSNEIAVNASKTANITKIFIHEQYQPDHNHIHDVALIELEEAIRPAKGFYAVKLPKFDQVIENANQVTLIGWGLNASGGVLSKHLQQVTLQVYENSECSKLHDIDMHDTVICAGVPGGGKGQCSGDSGGPLLDANSSTQIGIVSWSRKPCTIPPYPGVFTAVAKYIDWILQIILQEQDLDFNDIRNHN